MLTMLQVHCSTNKCSIVSILDFLKTKLVFFFVVGSGDFLCKFGCSINSLFCCYHTLMLTSFLLLFIFKTKYQNTCATSGWYSPTAFQSIIAFLPYKRSHIVRPDCCTLYMVSCARHESVIIQYYLGIKLYRIAVCLLWSYIVGNEKNVCRNMEFMQITMILYERMPCQFIMCQRHIFLESSVK